MTEALRRRAPEKRIQQQIRKNLELLGFDVCDLTQPRATMLPRGLPDLYVRHRRWKVRLWIEVKAPKGKTTPFQDYWIGTERACGGAAIVAYTWSDVQTELVRLGCPIR